MIASIKLTEFGTMTTAQKVERMDAFLIELRREKIPYYDLTPDSGPFVKLLIGTKIYLEHPKQDKLIWDFFDLILQIEYINSYAGLQNSILSSLAFKRRGWQSPASHVSYNSLTQAIVVGSRIEFERLMRFIYFVFCKKEITGDSTFATFKDWLFKLDPLDDLVYMIPFLKVCRVHDNKYRTAEIHTGSQLKSRTLALIEHERDEQNKILDLHNHVTNLLQSILPLLNQERPNSVYGSGEFDQSWITPYVNKDKETLTAAIKQWKDSIT